MTHKYSWSNLDENVLELLSKDYNPDLTKKMMLEAINEAEKGTIPNKKKVGAIIVKEDEVIGRGCRGRYKNSGNPGYHAEYIAIDSSEESTKNSSMYVTLEPCSMRKSIGKQPCCNHIIKAGIKKVFIGLPDANKSISGQGIINLTRAGVRVYAANQGLENRLYRTLC